MLLAGGLRGGRGRDGAREGLSLRRGRSGLVLGSVGGLMRGRSRSLPLPGRRRRRGGGRLRLLVWSLGRLGMSHGRLDRGGVVLLLSGLRLGRGTIGVVLLAPAHVRLGVVRRTKPRCVVSKLLLLWLLLLLLRMLLRLLLLRVLLLLQRRHRLRLLLTLP